MSAGGAGDWQAQLQQLEEQRDGHDETWSATSNLRFKGGRLQQQKRSSHGRLLWQDVPMVAVDTPDTDG